MSIGGASVAVESVAAEGLGAVLSGALTMALDSSAGAKPEEAGGSGVGLGADRVEPPDRGAAAAGAGFGVTGLGDADGPALGSAAVRGAAGDAGAWTGTTARSDSVDAAVKPPSERPNGNTIVEV